MDITNTLESLNYEVDIGGIDLDEVVSASKKPGFPILIFQAAMLKDGIDAVSFGFMSYLTTPMYGIIIFFWALGKSGIVKKFLMKRIIKSAQKGLLRKMIPGINVLPWTTIFVWEVYRAEVGLAEMLKQISEEAIENREHIFDAIIEAAV